MSIALQRNNSGGGHEIEGPGFVHREMAYVSSASDAPELSGPDRRSPEAADPSGSLSSSSSSSIGKNSDEHPRGGSGSDEEEVQSEYKGGPLDSLDSLEEVLPVKHLTSRMPIGARAWNGIPLLKLLDAVVDSQPWSGS